MKYFSMFSGIGGFDLALNRFNNQCIGYSEIDRYAIQTYKKNFGEVKNYGDATEINTRELPDFDLLVGGFPCQSFSIAGKRKGFKDTRGTLFFEIARIIKDKRPKYIILENVKGLLNHNKGETFKVIIQTLEELGYNAEWQVLNSKHYGVPQNRERVFIIGHLRGQSTKQIFPIRQSSKRFDDSKKGVKSEAKITSAITTKEGQRKENNFVVVGTLRTHKDGRGFRKMRDVISPAIPARAREDGSDQPVITIPCLTPDRPEKRQNGRRFKTNGEEMFTLTGQDVHGILTNNSIRRLTPVECERLQGFPDNWTEGVSDSQRYKQLGNAVTVNVIECIIQELF